MATTCRLFIDVELGRPNNKLDNMSHSSFKDAVGLITLYQLHILDKIDDER